MAWSCRCAHRRRCLLDNSRVERAESGECFFFLPIFPSSVFLSFFLKFQFFFLHPAETLGFQDISRRCRLCLIFFFLFRSSLFFSLFLFYLIEIHFYFVCFYISFFFIYLALYRRKSGDMRSLCIRFVYGFVPAWLPFLFLSEPTPSSMSMIQRVT